MQPSNFKFGGGTEYTVLHPVVLVAMLVTIVLVLVLPRKYVVIPFLVMSFLVPRGQQIYYAGVHILVGRIIILAALTRMVASIGSYKRLLPGGVSSIDLTFMLWVFYHAFAFIVLYQEMGAVVNQVGMLWDFAGAFLVWRFLIRDKQDIDRTIKTFAIVVMVLAIFMTVEKIRDINVFGYLGGGVSVTPGVREGAIRSQGPFAHALLAGTFGAVLLPLFVWLWSKKSRLFAVLGILGSTVITLTSASSTPVMAYAVGVGGLCLWPLRRFTRRFHVGIVVLLVLLQAVMKAPVWFLIARMDLVSGSSGYHRALLVDQFLRHFFDWWLIGTNNNFNWGWDMWDTCNQFVQEGENGGLIALLALIALIWICFRKLAKARRNCRADRKQEWFYWILTTSLLANVVAFLGISYFDQTRNLWFAVLAMYAAATLPSVKKAAAVQRRAQSSFRYPPPTVPMNPEPARLQGLNLPEEQLGTPRS
jgi:hypothetical protein